MRLLATISCAFFLGCLFTIAQVPTPRSTSSNSISGANWSKKGTLKFVLRDENGNVLSDIEDLVYLSTNTLSVLDKTNRKIYLLHDFKEAENGETGRASVLASDIGKNFFVTNPNSFSTFINEEYTSDPFANINGSYVFYVLATQDTYLLKDIRKFSDWGAGNAIKLPYTAYHTYWYRDAENGEYGIVEKGETLDYDRVTSEKDGNDLIIKWDGIKKYVLLGYYTKASFVFTPVKMYNDNTATVTTVTSGCVRGDCENGWGKYEYDGGHYDGFWKNGLKHGYGLYKWEDSGKYIGNWANDYMDGYGVYIAANNDNIIGEYSRGQLNGRGITVTGDTWKQGIYSDGSLVTSYDFYSNSEDMGCTSGDCEDKYGRFEWENGDSYTGFFKNGKLHLGTYTFSDGNKYSGMFNSNNEYHGMGRFFFKDDQYYGGQWRNGKYHGLGYYHDTDLKQSIGEWANGVLIKSMK